MIRFLAYILIFFILFRLVGSVFKLFLGNREQNAPKKRGNVNVQSPTKEDKKKKGYKGGEYIDYEEVD